MKRLHLHIYLTLLGCLIAFAVITGAAWRLLRGEPEFQERFGAILEIADLALPGPDRPPVELEAALSRLNERFDADLAVFGADGRLLGSIGPPPPRPPPHRMHDGPRGPDGARRPPGPRYHEGPRFARGRVIASMRLSDGRMLVMQRPEGPFDSVPRIFVVLAAGALAVGIAAYPFARRLTRRLQALEAAVEGFGSGDLTRRADIPGRDEVASLAQRFNHTADRIEALLGAHKTLLANASHELRSPLARLRMALEMLPELIDPKRRTEIARNIAELDQLVGEILLASRLESRDTTDSDAPVDLLALVAEEAAAVGAEVEGEPTTIRGDARLLARMVRNLLENARRHGGGGPIEVRLDRSPSGRPVLAVEDRGPGIPEDQRERIFEPFYRPPGTPERDGGVGLGLALVRQIAVRHGATVASESREGGGGRFVVRFG